MNISTCHKELSRNSREVLVPNHHPWTPFSLFANVSSDTSILFLDSLHTGLGEREGGRKAALFIEFCGSEIDNVCMGETERGVSCILYRVNYSASLTVMWVQADTVILCTTWTTT